MDIPQGNSREEVRMRDKIIKDFYAGWIAENPDKKMWNDDLQDYILAKSKKIAEVPIKKGTKNQKPFLKMFIMQLDNIKMTVGLQKSTGDKVQYCITSL